MAKRSRSPGHITDPVGRERVPEEKVRPDKARDTDPLSGERKARDTDPLSGERKPRDTDPLSGKPRDTDPLSGKPDPNARNTDPPCVDWTEATEPSTHLRVPRRTDPGVTPRRTLCAVFIAEGVATTYRLPEEGTVTVGRSSKADLTVSHPSISREHARVHLGEHVFVEDLGSSNGTCIDDVRLEPNAPHPITVGGAVDRVSVMMTLQYGERPERPRRILSHGYFEMRVEEECNRRGPADRWFALLRVRGEADSHELVREALAVVLRPSDVIAIYSPDEYEILLLDCAPPAAHEIELRAKEALSAYCGHVLTGLALFPRDGRSPEALLAAVEAAIRGEPDAGPVVADDVVVADDAMGKLYGLGERVAKSNLAVLLIGETGVGKEIMASHVQRCSDRADAPFLRLNCAALSEALLESELFGFERGAFTDAAKEKPGLLESAHGGTVFFDELGELPLPLQAKLLEVVEDKQVRRVGGLSPRPADVRFISATNRDLERAVTAGRFRQDLYYRLNGITIVIPPLRDRIGEVEPLARRFLTEAGARSGTTPLVLSDDALAVMCTYQWPGNIRELRNVIERALILSRGAEIGCEHLPTEKMTGVVELAHAPPLAPIYRDLPGPSDDEQTMLNVVPVTPAGLSDQVEQLERQRIVDALAANGGNQSAAARALGLSRGALLRRIKRYQIDT